MATGSQTIIRLKGVELTQPKMVLLSDLIYISGSTSIYSLLILMQVFFTFFPLLSYFTLTKYS